MHAVREAGKPLRMCLSVHVRDPITVILLYVSISAIVCGAAKLVLFNELDGLVGWWSAPPPY